MAIATYKVMLPILGHLYFGLEAASYRLTVKFKIKTSLSYRSTSLVIIAAGALAW